jgi:hypothetical protein
MRRPTVNGKSNHPVADQAMSSALAQIDVKIEDSIVIEQRVITIQPVKRLVQRLDDDPDACIKRPDSDRQSGATNQRPEFIEGKIANDSSRFDAR